MSLPSKVAVVPLGGDRAEAVARRLAAEGATVVLVSDDAAAAGRLASEIESAGTGRPAVYVSEGDDLDGLVEFLAELFRTDPA